MARTRREFIKTTAAAGAMFGPVGEPQIGLIVSQKSRPLGKASLGAFRGSQYQHFLF